MALLPEEVAILVLSYKYENGSAAVKTAFQGAYDAVVDERRRLLDTTPLAALALILANGNEIDDNGTARVDVRLLATAAMAFDGLTVGKSREPCAPEDGFMLCVG